MWGGTTGGGFTQAGNHPLWYLEDEFEAEEKARIAQEHKEKSRRAFRRPPKRCGRGQLPPKKWGPRKR